MPLQYLLCKGFHKMSYYPHQVPLGALQVSMQESDHLPTWEKEEDQDTPRMGALKFLSAIQKKVDQKEVPENGLMFVDAAINLQPSKNTLVDLATTHNFIFDQKVRKLRLKIEDPKKMKAINSEALPIIEISQRASLKIGAWSREMDLVVVHMDDFDVVLEMDFLLEYKVISMSLAKCILIIDCNPIVIPQASNNQAT